MPSSPSLQPGWLPLSLRLDHVLLCPIRSDGGTWLWRVCLRVNTDYRHWVSDLRSPPVSGLGWPRRSGAPVAPSLFPAAPFRRLGSLFPPLQSPIRSRGRLPVGLGSSNKIPVPSFPMRIVSMGCTNFDFFFVVNLWVVICFIISVRFANRTEIRVISVGKPISNFDQTKPRPGSNGCFVVVLVTW